MNKSVWSIILLCLMIVSFVFTVAVFTGTCISSFQLENAEIDMSEDKLSIIGVAFTSFSLWFGFILISGATSSIGFICSLINTKIAQNMVILRISKIFLYFYSVVIILLFSAFVFFVSSGF